MTSPLGTGKSNTFFYTVISEFMKNSTLVKQVLYSVAFLIDAHTGRQRVSFCISIIEDLQTLRPQGAGICVFSRVQICILPVERHTSGR